MNRNAPVAEVLITYGMGTEVFIRGIAALGSSERYRRHDVRMTLSQV